MRRGWSWWALPWLNAFFMPFSLKRDAGLFNLDGNVPLKFFLELFTPLLLNMFVMVYIISFCGPPRQFLVS